MAGTVGNGAPSNVVGAPVPAVASMTARAPVQIESRSVQCVAESLGLALPEKVASELANDADFRLRLLAQEAGKVMRHGRRTRLTSVDVATAISLLGCEPIHGYTIKQGRMGGKEGENLFKEVPDMQGVFYINDPEVDLRTLSDQYILPKVPLAPTMRAHWLAIEGIQPATADNALGDGADTGGGTKRAREEGKDFKENIKLPVKHFVAKELMQYFQTIRDTLLGDPGSRAAQIALTSVSSDAGLHPLVPYFSQLIADQVTGNLRSLPVLTCMIRLASALVANACIHVEPYLHQLMPPIITCIVAKKLGSTSEDHWQLRRSAAALTGIICKRFGSSYEDLQERIARTLFRAFLDPTKPLTTHFGALHGLICLGPLVVEKLVLPNARAYAALLLERKEGLQARLDSVRIKSSACSGTTGTAHITDIKNISSEMYELSMCESALMVAVGKASKEALSNLDVAKLPPNNMQKPSLPNQDQSKSAASAVQLVQEGRLSEIRRDLDTLDTNLHEIIDSVGDDILPYIGVSIPNL